jgi:hypothetical protein
LPGVEAQLAAREHERTGGAQHLAQTIKRVLEGMIAGVPFGVGP